MKALLLLAALICINVSFVKAACEECSLTKNWNAVSFCNLNGTNCFANTMCPFNDGWFTLFSKARCLSENTNSGVIYPGSTLGCPNNCFEDMNYGTCTNKVCKCVAGRGGQDCSRIKCPYACSSHGSCVKASPDYCKCSAGWIGEDCSVPAPNLTPLPQLKEQYSSDSYGEDHPAFYPLSAMYINVTDADYRYMLNPIHAYTEKVFLGQALFHNPQVTQVLKDVGVKLRGGVTRRNLRKSFSIDFSYTSTKQKLVNLKKVALRSLPFDPSYGRDKAVHDLLYYIGVKRPRSGFVQLFINDIYFGLYAIQEFVDEDFLKSRYGANDGALWKVDALGFLDYKGDDPALYSECKDPYNKFCYEPKTSAAKKFDSLVAVIKALNISSDSMRKTELPKLMNIDNILRNLVVEMAHGNTDGILNGKNYYLYAAKSTPIFEIIPHDFDFALGFKSFNLTTAKNIWDYEKNKDRPLYSNIIPNIWKSETNSIFWSLLDQFAWASTSTIWKSRVNEYHRIIGKATQMDKWHAVDYAWNYKDFSQSSLVGGILRTGTTGTCGTRDCLWVTSVSVHVDHQVGQIKRYLSPKLPAGKQ